MNIGYARVSTVEQHTDLQTDALAAAGCERIFTDQASGIKTDRPQLQAALNFARSGDVFVVWRLDRLGRSIIDLIKTVQGLNSRNIGFKSVRENINTTTPGGKLVFHVFAALAEFERELIQERTKAGLSAARARGRKGGRKSKLDDKKQTVAQSLRANRDISVKDACKALGVSRSTFYRRTKA